MVNFQILRGKWSRLTITVGRVFIYYRNKSVRSLGRRERGVRWGESRGDDGIEASWSAPGSGAKCGPIVLAAFLAIASPASGAEYIATGPIAGQVCWGIGIQFCKMPRIDAVRGKGDQLYEINTRYAEVTEFNGRRCIIRIKSRYDNPVGWLMNYLRDLQFYTKLPNGQFEKVDPEYLTFRQLSP